MKCISIFLFSAAALCGADFTTGQAARLVIGQTTFTSQDSNSSDTILGAGSGLAYAGDTLFDYCYLRDFPGIARLLRDDLAGSFDELLRRVAEEPTFNWGRYGSALSLYAYACAYTPDPDRPGKPLMPLDPRTGRIVPDVWERWLELDPVRMAEPYADSLRGMRRIYLDAGRQDEFFLDLGAQAFSDELTRLGIGHTLELFDGTHSGISYRYPAAVRELVLALG